MSKYPQVKDTNLVGTYPGFVHSGGGFVWDEVLEYRVWCHPLDGAPQDEDGDDSDYFYFFDNYDEALEFSEDNPGTEEPLALILQVEHINEPEPGRYIHVKEERLTEWRVEFLNRPKRTPNTIPDFLSSNSQK